MNLALMEVYVPVVVIFVLFSQMNRVINKGPLPYQYMKVVLYVCLLCCIMCFCLH